LLTGKHSAIFRGVFYVGAAQFLGGNWRADFVSDGISDDARGDRPGFRCQSVAIRFTTDNLCAVPAIVSNKNIMACDISFPNFDAKFGAFSNAAKRSSSGPAEMVAESCSRCQYQRCIRQRFRIVQHRGFIRAR
jgi:hypothetical protein